MPAAMQADRAVGCCSIARSTASSVVSVRNDSRRVPKWCSSAPNDSGRTATRSSSRHGRSRSNLGAGLPGVPVRGDTGASVDTAHPVDRDLFHQQLAGDRRLILPAPGSAGFSLAGAGCSGTSTVAAC